VQATKIGTLSRVCDRVLAEKHTFVCWVRGSSGDLLLLLSLRLGGSTGDFLGRHDDDKS
jgi:hypothetical protein